MAKKSMMTDAKETIVDAAKTGAEGAKVVAGEALGAAAAAAAQVVLTHMASALATGEKKLDAAKPAATEAARMAVAAPFKPASTKKPPSKKARAQTKMVGKNKKAPKAQANRKPSSRGR